MKKIALAGTALLLFFGLGVSAAAASPGSFEEDRVLVSFADLNIQNKAGARVLYTRLQRASADVCSLDSYRELGSLALVAGAEECYVAALDKAVSKIDSEALARIHSS